MSHANGNFMVISNKSSRQAVLLLWPDKINFTRGTVQAPSGYMITFLLNRVVGSFEPRPRMPPCQAPGVFLIRWPPQSKLTERGRFAHDDSSTCRCSRVLTMRPPGKISPSHTHKRTEVWLILEILATKKARECQPWRQVRENGEA